MLTKRIMLMLVALGAMVLVVGSVSFALFTATTSNASNTYTSGTVTLAAPLTTMSTIIDIAPGDSGSDTYTVSYQGSLPAWVGFDTDLTGELTTCDPGKFTVSITDPASNSYNPNLDNQVFGGLPLDNGDALSLTIAWGLDLSANNNCQNKSASFVITTHAIQSENNTNAAGTGPISWN